MEKKIKSLSFHILVPIMLSFIIWMLIPDYTVFYDGLIKPAPQLPQEAFVICFSSLYFLMGSLAACVELTKYDPEYQNQALNLYYINLLVMLLWMPFFFGFQNLFVAMLWSILLLIIGILMFRKFLKIKPKAGYLMIIYLLWVLFLTYFTIAIYIMN